MGLKNRFLENLPIVLQDFGEKNIKKLISQSGSLMSETLMYKILAQLEKPEISTGVLPDFRLVKMLDDTVNVIFSKS